MIWGMEVHLEMGLRGYEEDSPNLSTRFGGGLVEN